MVIYTTLKENKNNNISYWDIAIYCEETITVVADLFENGEKYHDDTDETDFDKLYQDYSERQVANIVLKFLRQYAKEKDTFLLNWTDGKVFIDLDYGIPQLKQMIEDGLITGSGQLRDINDKAKKKGFTLRYDYEYDKVNHYFKHVYVDDLIDEYFPCRVDLEDLDCNDCGNCQ